MVSLELALIGVLVYFIWFFTFNKGSIGHCHDNLDLYSGVLIYYLGIPYMVFASAALWFIFLPIAIVLGSVTLVYKYLQCLKD